MPGTSEELTGIGYGALEHGKGNWLSLNKYKTFISSTLLTWWKSKYKQSREIFQISLKQTKIFISVRKPRGFWT